MGYRFIIFSKNGAEVEATLKHRVMASSDKSKLVGKKSNN